MLPSLLICFVFSVLFVAAPVEVSARLNTFPGESVQASNAQRGRATRRRPIQRRLARAPAGSQMRPSRERVRQIQQALLDAGFNPGPVDGFWGPNSATALMDFQEARDLEPTGRINALSLIQLGLGPKYETANTPAGSPSDGSGPAR